MNDITPESYLESIGIDLKATTLICYIDGAMRQPNLLQLLNGYHIEKQKESVESISLSVLMSNNTQNLDGSIVESDESSALDNQ